MGKKRSTQIQINRLHRLLKSKNPWCLVTKKQEIKLDKRVQKVMKEIYGDEPLPVRKAFQTAPSVVRRRLLERRWIRQRQIKSLQRFCVHQIVLIASVMAKLDRCVKTTKKHFNLASLSLLDKSLHINVFPVKSSKLGVVSIYFYHFCRGRKCREGDLH